MDVLSDISCKTIEYLESSSEHSLKGSATLKRISRNSSIIDDVLLSLITDEDFRVRESACSALVR